MSVDLNLRIRVISDSADDFEKVIKLARANSGTLGFLPKGAFSGHAVRGQLLGAFDESNRFLGYLLYAANMKERFVYIVHLCVDKKWRQRGISRVLFNELRKKTNSKFRGIRVTCRRDYQEATKVWENLGFVVAGERMGRSKKLSILTVWWFDYGHPDLFRQAFGRSENKVRAVIDANVFFEIQNSSSKKNKESKALLADWLQNSVELCLTQEIQNEINRHSEPVVRKEWWAHASRFTQVWCPRQKFEKTLRELHHHFPTPKSPRDESDFRHLAWVISSDTSFFITRDKKWLRRGDKLYDEFGIQVWPPFLFIINQQDLGRENDYQPARLMGSQLKIQSLKAGKVTLVEQVFRARQQETKAEFINRLHFYLAEPGRFEILLVIRGEEPMGLIVLNREEPTVLRIPFLRLSQNKLSPTLARHLLHDSVITATREERLLLVLDDPYLSTVTAEVPQELGFVEHEGIWLKVNLNSIDTAHNIGRSLERTSDQFLQFASHFQNLSNWFHNALTRGSLRELFHLEKALSPAKITDLDCESFVIPIRPQWASHLFDSDLANQDLFGSEPALIFNVENAYYRSSRTNVLSAPARILWYVSRGTNLRGTMAIRACSYLDEVVIDKPKVVFSKFRRLGVYSWQNVLEIAKGNTDNNIMAFRFSNTELFDNPIKLSQLSQEWKKANSTFFPVAPLKIDKKMFFDLYKMAKTKRCENAV